ncbi:unnamed protein product [Caenorhabditis auriculariae]|uniref:Uncharacterized protein n=1 Tax=Caenorhabditis auriculariae TaxID=2777116 RepID=A0A8S1HFE4_9PELO|nr:unnamed protein product [Caenorhabditis auriculariae]
MAASSYGPAVFRLLPSERWSQVRDESSRDGISWGCPEFEEDPQLFRRVSNTRSKVRVSFGKRLGHQ